MYVWDRTFHKKPKKQKKQAWAGYSLHHILVIKIYIHFSNIYKLINSDSKTESCLRSSHTSSKLTWWLVTAINPFISKWILQYISEYCHSLLINGKGITPWLSQIFPHKDHNIVHQANNRTVECHITA